MKITRNNSKIEYLLFGLMMFSSTMSFVSIVGVKIWYISLALCFLFFLFQKKIRVPHTIFYLFIAVTLVSSLVNVFEFGIKRDFFNFIFGAVLVCIAYTFSIRLETDRMEDVLKKVAILNAIAVFINTIIQLEAVKLYVYFDYLDHPPINSLSSGGTNIDATWLSLYCAAFYKSKYKWAYMLYSVLINTLYAARVGYMINAFLICVFLYQERKKLYKVWTKILLLIPFAVYFFISTGILEKAFSRFSNIGQVTDEGGIHRLLMWESVPKVIFNYPYGVGIGNSMDALNKVTGRVFSDGNYHNLFLEYFGSAGVLGGCLYILMVIYFFRYCIKRKKHLNTIMLMLACYVIGGLVQFSGDESIMFLLVGGFLGLRYKDSLKNNAIGIAENEREAQI